MDLELNSDEFTSKVSEGITTGKSRVVSLLLVPVASPRTLLLPVADDTAALVVGLSMDGPVIADEDDWANLNQDFYWEFFFTTASGRRVRLYVSELPYDNLGSVVCLIESILFTYTTERTISIVSASLDVESSLTFACAILAKALSFLP